MFNSLQRKVLKVFPSLFSLAVGEGISRICNLLLLIFVSHRFGVATTGAFALAQGLALYLMLGIDLGLRHIGARLIADKPEQAMVILRGVQKKRICMMILVVTAGFLYGQFGPIPHDARKLVSLFALSMAGYAFSLDWLAWGLKAFRWMSIWRASASLLTLLISVSLVFGSNMDVISIAIGNAIGYLGAAYLLWKVWGKAFLSISKNCQRDDLELQKQISWRAALSMGLALLFNQAFNNIDLILLGAYSSSHDVGLYNAAYRLILMLLAVYYLLTQSLFPILAKQSHESRTLSSLKGQLLVLFGCGAFLAVLLNLVAPRLLELFYGQEFLSSYPLLRILVVILPLDFVTSYLCNAMVAWGLSRRVLIATTSAMITNITLNLYLLPHWHAFGAAWATDISYIVLLLAMLLTLSLQRSSAAAILPATEGAAR